MSNMTFSVFDRFCHISADFFLNCQHLIICLYYICALMCIYNLTYTHVHIYFSLYYFSTYLLNKKYLLNTSLHAICSFFILKVSLHLYSTKIIFCRPVQGSCFSGSWLGHAQLRVGRELLPRDLRRRNHPHAPRLRAPVPRGVVGQARLDARHFCRRGNLCLLWL